MTREIKSSKVNVLLLSEAHNDRRCEIENSRILHDYISKDRPFLCVSEGHGINPCYQAIPPDRIIPEYEGRQDNREMLHKFFLMQQLIYGLVTGELKDGTALTDSVRMSKQFMMVLKHYFVL